MTDTADDTLPVPADDEGEEPQPSAEVAVPTRRSTGRVLASLTPKRLPDVDPSEPLLPEWLHSWDSMRRTAGRWSKRNGLRVLRWLVNAPKVVVLLVVYSPRGLARLVGKLSAYLYDYDSAQVRHHHAGKTETAEYVKAQNVRKANLRARWMVFGAAFTVVSAPILAFLAPLVLASLASLMLFVFIVKLIPGRSLGEVVVAFVVSVGAWFGAWWALGLLPELPSWPFIAVLVACDLALGWFGRPERPLVAQDASAYEGELVKPTAPMVVDALVSLGISGLTEKTAEQIRVYAPGVARAARGYTIEMELPPGVTAAEVMDRREPFAGALRRKLGNVWPSRGPNHPGHLRCYISDKPMAEEDQGTWAVSAGRELDIFLPTPMFTNQQGKWVDLTFAYNHFVVGGQPGFGKSYALRQIGVALAFDPRTMIVCLDGKGNGDLRPLRLVAHAFHEGDEEDEIADQLLAIKNMRQEMRRRNRFLRDLPAEENPQNKVTSELVDRYPSLAPIVLLVDEVQVYTEHDDAETKKAFIAAFTDLVKRGRSAGIIPVFCTQKPDAKALPSAIADNCTMRLCFKVHGWRSNDQILGSEMHANGVKATLFSNEDKGIAYLRGDGDEARIVRTVHGLDQVKAEELCAIARQIRQRKGMLSGYAAGDEAQQEEEQVDFLADCREVMGSAKAMHLPELLRALASLNGHWSELDTKALSSMLKAAGVKRGTVWSPALKADGYGVKAESLEVAATSDVEAIDDDRAPGLPPGDLS